MSITQGQSSQPAIWGVSIGDYLIRRLQDFGVRDIFGIPGDYVLAFYAMLEQSPIHLVGCTREDCAGFAADAYARLNGIGAVCVTYGVGGLSLCNSIAGAYAEKSPVVVISGSPGMRERFNNPLLHHRVQGFPYPGRGVPPHLLRRSGVGRSAHGPARDRPRVGGRGPPPPAGLHRVAARHGAAWFPTARTRPPARRRPAIRTSLAEAVGRGRPPHRGQPAAGHHRRRGDSPLRPARRFAGLAEGAGIPITATMLGKSVVSERHPLFVGIYEGALGREEVTRFVEESDCVILLGEFMTDINMGIFTANLDPARCIYATSETLRISHHHFNGVLLGDFIRGLAARRAEGPAARIAARARKPPTSPSNSARTIRSRSGG